MIAMSCSSFLILFFLGRLSDSVVLPLELSVAFSFLFSPGLLPYYPYLEV